jgi:putative pyruvate formate lyase activating enzyme
MSEYTPRYLSAQSRSSLRIKARQAAEQLSCCTMCPRGCQVNRADDETGVCRTGRRAVVASYDAHFGEEAPLVGRNGSGTIFFSHCNLLCSFCQNCEISHHGTGYEVSADQLARIMLDLQTTGCHNINFVTPSHVVAQILAAVLIAADKGLRIPLVYNTSGYDNVETLELLDGVVDIYMPDFKFWDPDIAQQTCAAPDYPEAARMAVIEMHRQVGDLVIGQDGLAVSGLLVRHLVLPNGLAGTRSIMEFIARRISTHTYVNVMNQYRPCGDAGKIDALARSITDQEYAAALNQARRAGLSRLDQRRRAFLLF